MAELFLAQEPPSPELVVIKRILPYLTEEPDFVQMFLDEARIAAQLHHPNIVQVFGLGKIDESIFIAMEYVEGVDLRHILAEETKYSATVPYAVASRICAQVAAGLDHAHNSKGVDGRPLGLIHRDVSPQNVMVAYNGSVKLVDFGIAKAEALAERSKPGVIKGKFLYLSPEAVMQERLDARADIFALGTMIYEITTGRAPFARATTEGILYAIRFETPSPPHLIRDDYPQELSRIVMKCLTKDRNQRYQRASQVQADLEALLDSGVMRQSDDVAEYIARLLGEEEERTMLHVPIPASGKGAAPQPAGLVARPARRPSADSLPLAGDPDDAEMATEMARPRDMLAAASGPSVALGEEDDEADPTAIRTMPGRPSAQGMAAVAPKELPRTSTSESTVQERAAPRPSGSTPRRPLAAAPARKPATSGPVASLERRRVPPPVELDEEEDDSGSVSVTPATVTERQPSGRAAASFRREEDSQVDTRSDVSDLLAESRTAPIPVAHDLDDDESTAGYHYTPLPVKKTKPRASRRPSLLLVGVVTLLLMVGAVAAWLFLLAPVPPRVASTPTGGAPGSTVGGPAASEPQAPTGEGASSGVTAGGAAPTPEPGVGAGTASPDPTGAVAGEGTEAAPAGQAPTPEGTGQVAAPEATGQGTGAPDAVAAGQAAKEGEETAQQPPPPSEVEVRFKAPARSVLKVGGRAVKPNDTLSLAPGPVRIDYRCPGRRAPKGRTEFEVPGNSTEPVVYTLDCRQKSRR